LQLQASSNMSLRINIPPATRICLVSLLTLSLLYNIARWRQIDTTGGTPTTSPLVPYLTLVPSFFYYYPWTIVTATFVEQNIFTVVLNAATVFYGGKYLERAWGSREFSKFIAVVAVIPCIAIIPIYLIWGAIGGSSSRAYASPLSLPLRQQEQTSYHHPIPSTNNPNQTASPKSAAESPSKPPS
jgi:membrane associated rhomboid family serine protease